MSREQILFTPSQEPQQFIIGSNSILYTKKLQYTDWRNVLWVNVSIVADRWTYQCVVIDRARPIDDQQNNNRIKIHQAAINLQKNYCIIITIIYFITFL